MSRMGKILKQLIGKNINQQISLSSQERDKGGVGKSKEKNIK